MRRFVKKPGAAFVVIPGVGRLKPGQVLEGDEYERFVPLLLVELPPEPRFIDPLEDTVETPINIPPEAIPPKPSVVKNLVAKVFKKPVPKNEPFATAAELKQAVEEENKKTEIQIEEALERLTPEE